MPKSLVIVESPAKARAIQQYLGSDYDVKASMGHVRDLPKKDGIAIRKHANGYSFKPVLENIRGKEKVIKELLKSAKTADAVYLAPDPDREGEAIAFHISELLNHAKTYRVMFHEVTKAAVKEAFLKPGKIDQKLVLSQQARRILDRIVGFDVSQLLWDKVARGLSAGRVQTVALRLLVDREREIRRFVQKEYWTIAAVLMKGDRTFQARLIEIDGKKFEIPDEAASNRILEDLKDKSIVVTQVTASERRRHPSPPFITSTLQQEAARRLGYPVSVTMKLAQQLYEGVELEEGLTGLITYMRTDSVRVSEASIQQARQQIQATRTLGAAYLPDEPNRFKTNKSAQDAHEAIRPTYPERTPASLAKRLDRKSLALYKLIWSRFIASQCRPAVYDAVSVDLNATDRFKFRATGSTLKFAGFLKVYGDESEEKAKEDKEKEADEDGENQKLPELVAGDKPSLKKYLPEQHFTQPPPRFSEAALVKALEEKGIGRPSTYASIISTLKNRSYTHVEKRRLQPTDLGMSVSDLLVDAFPDIFNTAFTAEMETDLDAIEEGTMEWQKVLTLFYREFEKDMGTAEKKMPNLKAGVVTEHICPNCDVPMLLRYGKMGRFLACSKYPDCTVTHEVTESKDGKLVKLEKPVFPDPCPKCGGTMAFKRSRFGAFLACEKYPECRGVLPLKKIGEELYEVEHVVYVERPCPECGEMMEVKKSRFGRFLACPKYPDCKGRLPFLVNVMCPRQGCDGELCERQSARGKYYACMKYPECKYRSYDEPVRISCPKCSSLAMFRSKGSLHCGREGCDGTLQEPEAPAGQEAL